MCDYSPITFLLPLSGSNQCYVCLYRYVMLVRSFLLFPKKPAYVYFTGNACMEWMFWWPSYFCSCFSWFFYLFYLFSYLHHFKFLRWSNSWMIYDAKHVLPLAICRIQPYSDWSTCSLRLIIRWVVGPDITMMQLRGSWLSSNATKYCPHTAIIIITFLPRLVPAFWTLSIGLLGGT